MKIKFLTKKRVELGEGHIMQYTLFENKNWGGIWLYHWVKVKQNRFHTHAFASKCITLNGGYIEQVLHNGRVDTRVVLDHFKIRELPKNYCHRIVKAKPNTWTLVFFGPWDKHWYEYFQDTETWVKYAWGRKVVSKIKRKDPRRF